MRVILFAAAVLVGTAAHAESNDELKRKPPKVSFHANVDTETAIACLQEDNGFNVNVIRKDGYVDLAMINMGWRMILATVTPEGDGVRVEGRGRSAKMLLRRAPCMGLPGKAGPI